MDLKDTPEQMSLPINDLSILVKARKSKLLWRKQTWFCVGVCNRMVDVNELPLVDKCVQSHKI